MILSTYRISLDIHDAHSSVCLDMKKNDTGRRISITLTDGGFPYQISEECYAVFTATKPDGNILFHECEIQRNTIFYDVRPQTTAAVGLMECEIKLYGADDKLITSPGFNILVNDTSYTEGDEVQSETEVTALTHLISEAATVITEGENVIAAGEAVNAKSEELIGELTAAKVELDGQVADAKASAQSAGASATKAATHAQSAQNASTIATGKAKEASTAAENAKTSEESARGYAESAANLANAAADEATKAKQAAEEAKAAAEKIEDATFGSNVYTLAEGETIEDAPEDADVVIDPYGEVDDEESESSGTDLSLGVTGAAVGQIVKVSAVDENGVPTAWEPVALPDTYSRNEIDAIMGSYIDDVAALVGGDA